MKKRSLTGTPVNKIDRQKATLFAAEFERNRLAVLAREEAKVEARRKARKEAAAKERKRQKDRDRRAKAKEG